LRLSSAVWRYIEHELFNYEHTKLELQALKDEIIDGAIHRGEGSRSGPGKPTETKAVALASSPAIAQMERVVGAIDRAFRQLSDEHAALYELRYRQGLSWQQCCIEMPVSRANYFKLRRELVVTVGANLGLVNYAEVINGRT
jgi:RinA family phage transcriptional activator